MHQHDFLINSKNLNGTQKIFKITILLFSFRSTELVIMKIN